MDSDDGNEFDIDGSVGISGEDDELEELDKRGHRETFTIASLQLNGSVEVVLNGFGFDNKTVELSRRCLYTLNWPVEQ